jgi:alginate O-acetyltransferase complex protein AlgI
MFQGGGYWFLLPLVAVIYWMLRPGWRALFLAGVSFVYLITFDWRSVTWLLLCIVAFYWLAPRPVTASRRARRLLGGLLMAVLVFLAVFKYLPPYLPVEDYRTSKIWSLPLGISYFTFKLIHYAIERRRGNLPAHRASDLASYLLLFPTFEQGPIERFEHYLANRRENWSWNDVPEGLTRIVYGLIKRFALVEEVLPLLIGPLPPVGQLLEELSAVSPWFVWRFLVLSYLYAYLEFSAYCDIAIGSCRLLGIRIMENFNYPILAQNIAEFWQRWHMTLAGWCQAYVYMPMLGLTRSPYAAMYASFLTIGLWHNATLHWVAWGTYHATGVACFVTWRRRRRLASVRLPRWFGYPLTFGFVTVAYAWTCTYPDHSIFQSVRILAKLVGIDLDP